MDVSFRVAAAFMAALPVLLGGSSHQAAAPGVGDLEALFGRIWRVTQSSSQPAPGSIYIFLANGTLLETSCVETYRIASWIVDKNDSLTLRVTEDGRLAFTAKILKLNRGTLQFRQTLAHGKEQRSVTLTAITKEFVCPDQPKKNSRQNGAERPVCAG